MTTEPDLANASRPFTGDEYLESLRDGREVWIYGERVRDVTTHPAFRNTALSIARLYDALHDEGNRGVLAVPTDTGNGGFTHPFFKVPFSTADLLTSRDAIVAWQRLTYGWLGRSPDYKASLLATLGANAGFYAPYEANAGRWYSDAQERVLYLNHAIVNPPVDRDRPPDEVADVYVHIEDQRDDGIVVSGAKVVATNAALSQFTFVGNIVGAPLTRPEFGLVFIAPMATPGLKLLCRASYEFAAAHTGSPFDYPLSSRMDENDAVMIFDRALVPWENVLVCADAEKANAFGDESGFAPRFAFHGVTRLAVKFDFIAGLFSKAVALTGSASSRNAQAAVGEVLAWRNLFWALSDGMIQGSTPWVNGAVQPNHNYSLAYRVLAPVAYVRVKEIIQNTVGSSLIYLNSNAVDFKQEELRPYLDRYLRGSAGYSAVDRVKVMKLLWDALGSEFGGRHELYEINYAGSSELNRVQTLQASQRNGLLAGCEELVERCLREYDLDGWTVADLIDPTDVNIFAHLGRAAS